jgi:ComF family protein
MRLWLDAILAVVLAPVCAACGSPLESPTRGPVCGTCWSSIHPPTPPLCERCGDSLPTWRCTSDEAARCGRCRNSPSALDRSRSAGAYEGALRSIVHALKYDGRRSLAAPLGALMRGRGTAVLDGATAVIPVPLHRSRHRQRGFNQALDLARHLGLPVIPALRRIRATAIQADLPAAERHLNVREAFAVTRHARRLRGQTVVIVDDVSTTGATLEACAFVLKAAGVAEVRGLTAARVATVQP